VAGRKRVPRPAAGMIAFIIKSYSLIAQTIIKFIMMKQATPYSPRRMQVLSSKASPWIVSTLLIFSKMLLPGSGGALRKVDNECLFRTQVQTKR
ncbi:hypothetical protein, partial [Collinsella tanakaei]|uniref:hypothetical protein n=1 Tax=Collinsella tanakaei TaxID=626935 RepID=UPI00294361E9